MEKSFRKIDRLRNQINKNSTNSSKPSSTNFVISKQEEKISSNEYNYRIYSKKSSVMTMLSLKLKHKKYSEKINQI